MNGRCDHPAEIAASVGDEEHWHQWLVSQWVRRFEKGECSATEFSTLVVSEWGLDIAPSDSWRSPRLADRPYPGTSRTLGRGPAIGADRMPEQYELDALGAPDVFMAVSMFVTSGAAHPS